MSKKVYLENLGCAKNQVDAEVMLKLLSDRGWQHVLDASQADLIIVNTCGFIEPARVESINAFFSLKALNPKAKLILSGCLAQRYADQLELPEADAIFGNRDLGRLNELLDEMEQDDGQVVLTPSYPDPDREDDQRNELLNFKGSAYLKISEGCDHRCAYCAIPIIRGPLRSRPAHRILDDARFLIHDKGVKEIDIIAQDLAAYGQDMDGKSHFMELLDDLCKIEGNYRYRLLYIHPDAFPPELVAFVQSHRQVLPYFDIPIQHVAVPVLRSMGRTGDADTYLSLVNKIRSGLPDAVIRTTMMLGYPGETEDDFKQLLAFVKEARFDWLGCFVYSREENTKAYALVSAETQKKNEKEAARRKKELESVQEAITAELLEKKFVGNVYDVLIEEKIEGEDLSIGRIYSQAPEVDGATVVMGRDLLPGMLVKAGIRGVNGVDLDAAVLEQYNG
ncbi:MAG: 30S ribosomal protein S12 methylthiotransferase RimO [Spirochaetia bacterium]|jgi:ribosomal protein S12 methylthiotransferase|nr:30S ribosomal protein S12 methylthiotransferase RimO [Spirochaetia bacterium]